MRFDLALAVMAGIASTEALVVRAAAPVVELGYASYQGVHNATSG